jgi:Fe2+ or Zn2+ uptake regulation protein
VEETELCAAPPVTEVRKRHGFLVQHHEADLYGVCGKCA